MTDTRRTDVTGLLEEARRGTGSAHETLFEVAYAELRRIAGALMRRERPGHTLQPTELVHQAWLKLTDRKRTAWTDRAHFLNIASRAMRQVLVDHARRRGARKRLDPAQRVTLDDGAGHIAAVSVDVLALHEALERFATLDPRAARVVEARVFGGMSVREVAHVLEVSGRTVELDWTVARRWLARELRGTDHGA